jgi:SAM-dependent methyltransferase
MSNNLTDKERKQIGGIFNKEVYEILYDIGRKYVARLIVDIFKTTSIFNLLKNQRCSINEMLDAEGFPSAMFRYLAWMVKFIEINGLLDSIVENGENRYSFREKYSLPEKNELYHLLIKRDMRIEPSCRYMEHVANFYIPFLRQEIKGFEILFAKDKMCMWNAYFGNNNLGYLPFNQIGSLGLMKYIMKREDSIVLEVGCGTGGGTSLVLKSLNESQKENLIRKYIVSDVSPTFLRLTQKLISEDKNCLQAIEALKIDFNYSLVDQGIKKDSVDFIYAVNSIHVARNIFSTLDKLKEVLKTGGKIVITECVRSDGSDLLVQEFILNLLDDYFNVDTDSTWRTTPGFLPFEQWKKILKKAGFVNIENILNTDGIYEVVKVKGPPIMAQVIMGEK